MLSEGAPVKTASAGAAAPPPILSKSEYAAHKGWRPSYVTKLVKAGRLVLTADGKRIDVPASEKLLKETERVDRQGVRERHARERVQKPNTLGAESGASPSTPPPDKSAGGGGGEAPVKPDEITAYNKARAEREAAMAAMAVMEQRTRQGELVEVSQVRAMGVRIGGILRSGFERIGPRIGPVWATEQDPAKRERLLEAELRQILNELADELGKLGAVGA